jgi:hypothetical protein
MNTTTVVIPRTTASTASATWSRHRAFYDVKSASTAKLRTRRPSGQPCVTHGAGQVDLAVFEMLHHHRNDEFQAVVVGIREGRHGRSPCRDERASMLYPVLTPPGAQCRVIRRLCGADNFEPG